MKIAVRKARVAGVWIGVALIVAIALAAMVTSGLPKPNLTRKQAQGEAYYQLELYCYEKDLDVSLFGPPRAIRGTLAHGQLAADGSTYDVDYPTWDFYYTYRGRPYITVFVSYDSKTGIAEVMDVFQRNEKWPWSRSAKPVM